MASSLDDMEAYELLQIELDRSLRSYAQKLNVENAQQAYVLHVLNHWIEYICFVRHLSIWEEIVSSETTESFMEWYEQFGNKPNADLLKAFQNFFK